MKKFILFIFIIILNIYSPLNANPKAENGIFDLASYDLNKNKPIPLNGNWEFYWNQLISPDSFSVDLPSNSRYYFNIPQMWKGYKIENKEVSGQGFATFRLKVKGLEEGKIYGLKFISLGLSYKIWINKNLISEIGKVGNTKETSIPKMYPQIIEFTAKPTTEIIMQISNFHHRNGGPWNEIYIGTIPALITKRQNSLLFNFFLFGSMVIMGFYHLGLFALRRKDFTPFYFGIFCLVLGFRILFAEEKMIAIWNPTFSWETLHKIENFISFSAPIPFLLFLKNLFPNEFKELAKKLLVFWFALASTVTLILPAPYFTYSEIIIDLGLPALGIYPIYVLSLAIFRKRQGAIALLVGFIILFATVVNDVLYARSIIVSSYYMPFGIFCFIFSQAFILSTRFSQAFSQLEVLSEELIAKAKELKQKNIELSKLDKLKDEFLSSTSHELKTPLHGIIGIVESISKGNLGKLPKQVKDNLSLVTDSAQRLNRMVMNILDFSIIKNEKLELNLKPVDLNSLIQLSTSILKPMAEQKNLNLKYNQSDQPILINGDEDRLIQILTNLIGNSIKFTKEGYISVQTSIENNKVFIRIIDTGIGIEEDQISNIFQPFVKGVDSSGHSITGTGLGLSITKNLIQLHGGEIFVQSQKEKGTEFYFYIPLLLDEIEIYKSQKDYLSIANQFHVDIQSTDSYFFKNPNSKIQRSNLKKTVLIADDEPINIQILFNQLNQFGYNIVSVNNGKDALDSIRNIKPNLAIIDIMMPVMNGIEVCQKVREDYSRADIPIIIVSAKDRKEDIIYGLSIGANDYLSKPFSEDELLARMDVLLKIS